MFLFNTRKQAIAFATTSGRKVIDLNKKTNSIRKRFERWAVKVIG